MDERAERCRKCGSVGEACACESGAADSSSRFRLVPQEFPEDGPVEVPPTPLIREYKGRTVSGLGPTAADLDLLPSESPSGRIVPGPGFGRRRSWVLLWPLFAIMALVVVASTWIVLG